MSTEERILISRILRDSTISRDNAPDDDPDPDPDGAPANAAPAPPRVTAVEPHTCKVVSIASAKPEPGSQTDVFHSFKKKAKTKPTVVPFPVSSRRPGQMLQFSKAA